MVVVIVILVGVFLVYEWGSSTRNTNPPQGTSSGNGFLDALASAIAKAEGTDASANNPGSLSAGDVDSSQITGTFNDAGVVIIDSIENGWNALYNKLANILTGGSSVYSPDMTIQQFADTYTGGDNSDGWAQSVADSLGVTTDTTLADAQGQYTQ